MLRKILVVLTLTALLLLGTALATAQGGDVLADGLNNPRGLFFGPDGSLYVAEAGTGGPGMAVGPFGNEVAVGGSGQITMVSADGEQSVLVQGLPSMNAGNVFGTQAVGLQDGLLWIVQGEGPEFGLPFAQSLIGLDAESFRVQFVGDLFTPEAAENPDGDIVASQPTDLAFGPDHIYVANAGCNCIMRWSEADGVEIFTSWTIDDNPVPTSVTFGPEGDLYVGFLSGFPFAEGAARVERWTLDGELVATYEGLTAVTGVFVADDGTVYAVEHGRFGDSGWEAGSGRVVMAGMDGVTAVVDGLTRPYSIAQSPDGRLAVSVNSSGEPGSGQVLAFDMMME